LCCIVIERSCCWHAAVYMQALGRSAVYCCKSPSATKSCSKLCAKCVVLFCYCLWIGRLMLLLSSGVKFITSLNWSREMIFVVWPKVRSAVCLITTANNRNFSTKFCTRVLTAKQRNLYLVVSVYLSAFNQLRIFADLNAAFPWFLATPCSSFQNCIFR